jgi:hypothetical protein
MQTKELSDRDDLEIMQIICDDDRETDKQSLVEDEKRKHQVVEQALAMLASDGIFAYIYADIPHPNYPPGIPCVYQFNTLQSLIEYDEDGNRTENSSEKNAFFHSALWKGLVDNMIMFTPLAKRMGITDLDPLDPKTHRKRMEFLDMYVTLCYQDFQAKSLEIIDNPK